MPEAVAVLAVVVVTVVAWIGAWMHARNPANHNAADEIARLVQRAAWLEHRLVIAKRERWDGDMVATLSDEFDATSQELMRTKARARSQ